MAFCGKVIECCFTILTISVLHWQCNADSANDEIFTLNKMMELGTRDFDPPTLAAMAKEPIVIRQASKWEAINWTPNYLQSKLSLLRKVRTSSSCNFRYYEEDARWAKYHQGERTHTETDMDPDMFFAKATLPSEKRDYCIYAIVLFYYLSDELINDMQPFVEASVNGKGRLWLSSGGAISSMHYDESHNFFTQIYGRKKVTVFSPSFHNNVHLHPSYHPYFRQSQVSGSVIRSYSKKLPNYQSISAFTTIVHPGDILYIPPLWFHHVETLDFSISANVFSPSLEMKIFDAAPPEPFGAKWLHQGKGENLSQPQLILLVRHFVHALVDAIVSERAIQDKISIDIEILTRQWLCNFFQNRLKNFEPENSQSTFNYLSESDFQLARESFKIKSGLEFMQEITEDATKSFKILRQLKNRALIDIGASDLIEEVAKMAAAPSQEWSFFRQYIIGIGESCETIHSHPQSIYLPIVNKKYLWPSPVFEFKPFENDEVFNAKLSHHTLIAFDAMQAEIQENMFPETYKNLQPGVNYVGNLNDKFFEWQKYYYMQQKSASKVSAAYTNFVDSVDFKKLRSLIRSKILVYFENIGTDVDLAQKELFVWATLACNGSYHRGHVHGDSVISGVYYSKVPPNAGSLLFSDPRGTGPPFGSVYQYQPQPGHLLVFPSWLYHETLATRHHDERISFSFNIIGEYFATRTDRHIEI